MQSENQGFILELVEFPVSLVALLGSTEVLMASSSGTGCMCVESTCPSPAFLSAARLGSVLLFCLPVLRIVRCCCLEKMGRRLKIDVLPGISFKKVILAKKKKNCYRK